MRLAGKLQQSARAVDAVDELPVRKRRKQSKHEAEMNHEQRRHRRLSTQREKKQSRGARQHEHQDKRNVHLRLAFVTQIRIAPAPLREQTERSDYEPDPAERSENDRRAQQRVRRAPADQMIDS